MMAGQDLLIPLVDPVTKIDVPGFCLDPHLLPPPTPTQIAGGSPSPAWVAEGRGGGGGDELDAPRNIVAAGNTIAAGGGLHTDMPGGKQRETAIQRAIWNYADPAGYDKDKLFSDLKEQVQATGGKQTDKQINQLTDNVWKDVELILKQSGVKTTTTR